MPGSRMVVLLAVAEIREIPFEEYASFQVNLVDGQGLTAELLNQQHDSHPNPNCLPLYIPSEREKKRERERGSLIFYLAEGRHLGSGEMSGPEIDTVFPGDGESKADEEKKKQDKADDDLENSPIEEVRLTVPIMDDPTLPALTFRTWTLGLTSCLVLAFLNQFFGYRQNPLSVPPLAAQLVTLPLGRLMAAKLPKKKVKFPGTAGWEFSMNPGPFNVKEHVLITILANSGANGVYAVHIVTMMRALYHRSIHPLAAFLLSQTTQLLGYGWAGIFRKFMVDSPYMWWPPNLIQVALFRALHEKEVRRRGGTTRLQFFFVVFAISFAYYIVPNYLFPFASAFSIGCVIWKGSVLAQQLTSGYRGLGIGAFGLDWATISSYLGTPIATPGHAILNVMAGFVLFLYVLVPIAYWTDSYHAKRFPLISSGVFDGAGHRYDTATVINPKTFQFNPEGYSKVGPIHLSPFFVLSYGLNFATLAAIFTHIILFHGRSLWDQTTQAVKNQKMDVHTRLMRKNYERVPEWWFGVLLLITIALAFAACLGFGGQLQLPWWGILLACAVSFAFTLPIGILTATTNVQPGLNIITEMIIGYTYPGRPLANVSFKTYGYVSMMQAIYFLSDFKLGHYMKIPPKSMFVVQLVGTVVATSLYFGTSWWLLSTIPNICDSEKNPLWDCPNDNVFYSASIIWGVVGPVRMFGRLGLYSKQNWWFLAGLLAPIPVWVSSRMFPERKWIKLINVPVILGGVLMMPPAGAVNYWSWGVVGILFNVVIYKRYKKWWSQHTYVMSAGLDTGVAFSAVLAYFALQTWLGPNDEYGPIWWGHVDGSYNCDLAKCPTAAGVVVDGCPVVSGLDA
ncbi:oligopeptide transporter 5-like isoform X2 [Nymphaea colorata]|uniref:oligopeptide transporter 5-like isoform X2 n=1 Tax=Nymphaea colorata TaxID=210225 RepID=UPI00214F1811|nr:oligopeptide transporter 5-like isoform X2 [Nymphaea colorata]